MISASRLDGVAGYHVGLISLNMNLRSNAELSEGREFESRSGHHFFLLFVRGEEGVAVLGGVGEGV